VASLIQSVYQVLHELRINGTPAELPAPAVPIKWSVTPDYIVSLEDGRKLKTLKRYLRTSFDMTPDQYRRRWGLPADYPMTAPNYAKKRSQLAKKAGLGTRDAEARKGVGLPSGLRSEIVTPGEDENLGGVGSSAHICLSCVNAATPLLMISGAEASAIA
jgi:predicted transcriptional regulator